MSLRKPNIPLSHQIESSPLFLLGRVLRFFSSQRCVLCLTFRSGHHNDMLTKKKKKRKKRTNKIFNFIHLQFHKGMCIHSGITEAETI